MQWKVLEEYELYHHYRLPLGTEALREAPSQHIRKKKIECNLSLSAKPLATSLESQLLLGFFTLLNSLVLLLDKSQIKECRNYV